MMGIAELAGEYHRSVELLEDRLTQLNCRRTLQSLLHKAFRQFFIQRG